MKYQDRKLQSALAGEYVLGTLTPRARTRFERLMTASPELTARVREWERRLSPLNDATPAVEPPARVWRHIRSRISAGPRPAAPRRLRFWRGLGLTASAACILLAVLLLEPFVSPPRPGESYVSIVRDQADQPLWLVRLDADRDALTLTTLRTPAVETGKSLELWLLPQDGKPVSLGLLPTAGKTVMKLAAGDLVPDATGLAVSVEPGGGSPTGQPTGPVVFQARLFPLG